MVPKGRIVRLAQPAPRPDLGSSVGCAGHLGKVTDVTCNAAATTYLWTGGTCQGTTAPTCTVTPAATTTYGVTGTNNYGFSTTSTDVVVKAVDLTLTLMLLLD